jgi:putative heme-binding domain-containing protein
VLNLRLWKTCCFNVAWMLVLSLEVGRSIQADETLPFSVPEGFSVDRVADDTMVHDCFCMTLDGLGRPVVSGPGYIRTLVDDNKDGKYDRSFQWSNPKQGAQGLWSEGRKLYYVAEGGLWQSEDNDGDLIADPNPKKVLELPTGEEHHAHAIRRGPDGFWYLIAGNFAKDISNLQNDSISPVTRSRSGTIWRISPDFSRRGVWAHGMRNCYDFDFLPDGQIVTFDSDCEREATLPWYRPTRVMVMGPGSDAGWCGQSWKDEDHRITMPLVLAQLGRGSPTGVTVYQHRVFPMKYHDAVFVLDWTFGRVIAVYPSKNIDEDKRIPNKVPAEVFMQPTGTTGFAPTDICVGTDGSLLVCVGGRGTTGAIYRIVANTTLPVSESKNWFTDSVAKGVLKAEQTQALENILSANRPFDSWSEAEWLPKVEKVGLKAILEVMSGGIPISAEPEIIANAKLRCAQVLSRANTPIAFSQIQNALSSASRSTRAAAWWLVGRGNVSIAASDIKLMDDLSALDFASAPLNTDANDQSNWELHLGRADERLRWEAYGVRKISFSAATSLHVDDSEAGNSLRRTWLWALARSAKPLAMKTDDNNLDYLIAKQLYNTSQSTIDMPLLDALASWVPKKQPQWKTRDILEFLTVLQTALGERRLSLPQQQEPPQPDVLDGFKGLGSSKLPPNVRTAWIGWAMFLAKQAADADRQLVHSEAMRTLAMLEPKDQDSLTYCLNQVTKDSHPTSDIHALCCSANCQLTRTKEMTKKTAVALAGIVRKVKARGLYTDNQWPNRLQQLVTALLRGDSSLGTAFVELPVPCNAEDLTLVVAFPSDVQSAARKKMRQHLLASKPSEWSVPILRFAAQAGIDYEFANVIRESAAVARLRSTAVDLLSANPSEKDYELFLAEIESKDRNLWPSAWRGLSALSIEDAKREWQALAPLVSVSINTTGLLPRAPTLARARTIAGKLKLSIPPVGDLWKDWEAYYQNTLEPECFANLPLPQSRFDWRALVSVANTISGDAKRGQLIYQEKCALCHGGQSSLGPSLSGVAKRFSRDDLSIAIFEPSRTIPDRYRSLRILTTDAEIFTGMIVYTAADGTTLQAATGDIVRVNKDNIEDQGYSTESLMPAGLLSEKTPEEVADLYAFLATL